MTRRILLVLVAFTAIVLVGAVGWLTLNATSHDRASFLQATEGMDRADAAIAQAQLDWLANHPTPLVDGSLLVLIQQVQQSSDGLLIFKGNCALPDVSGQPLSCTTFHNTNMPAPITQWRRVAQDADEQARAADAAVQEVQPVTETEGSRVISCQCERNPFNPSPGTAVA